MKIGATALWRLMKKIITLLTTILVLSVFSVGVIYASASGEVSTEIFSPQTYLEFYELDAPRDYCYDKTSDTHVICEGKRIIIYKNDLFTVHDMVDYNLIGVRFFDENHLLFLSDGKLFSVKLDDFTITDTGFVANFFDVYGDYIVTSIGNSFYLLIASVDDNGLLSVSERAHYYEGKNYQAIAMTSETEWLCISEGTLLKFNSSGKGSFTQIANNLKDARYGCYYGGVYYVSRPNGVYSVDVDGVNGEVGATKLLKASSVEQKLGNVVSPQGLAFYDGMLYITDNSLNSIGQFDVNKNCFTGFYVTSRSDGSGRVSSFAEDLQTYGETVFALDRNALKSFGNSKNAVTTLPLSGNFTSFSVIENKTLVTNGNAIYAVKFDDNNDPQLINIEANLASFTSVTAISAFDDDFYFLNNTIIDSTPYTEIYKISSASFKEAVLVKRLQGRGDDLCTDIFGKLYVLVYKNSAYSITSFYDADETSLGSGATELFSISDGSTDIKSIVTDFECNVYALLADNKIARIDENKTATYYNIKVSDNLPTNVRAKDLAIVSATDEAYALFDGFILKLNPKDLSIASPSEIRVPQGYENILNDNAFYCVIPDETRYFQVDLAKTDDEYYYYTGYSTYYGKEEFVVLYTDDKYTLLANDNLSCVVRTKDITAENLPFSQDGRTAYLCYDAHLYTYPVLTEYFRSATLNENQKVTVLKTTSFNGVKFALVQTDDGLGYVPDAMLKSAIAVTDSPLNYQTLAVGRNGATVYSDKELTSPIGTLDAFESVKVIEKIGDAYSIEYDGSIAYVKASTVAKKGYTVIRNLILITVAVVAIMVTVAFVYKRKFSKFDDNQ